MIRASGGNGGEGAAPKRLFGAGRGVSHLTAPDFLQRNEHVAV